MSRVYSVVFENVSLAAAQDLFYIAPASNKPCRIHGFVLCNVAGTADAGDAKEQMVRLIIRRGYGTAGSGGTAPTPTPMNPGDPAAGFTARVNDTTLASGGTPVDVHADGWNTRTPFTWYPIPDDQPVGTAGQASIVVRLLAAPPNAVASSGTIYVEELG